MSFVIREKIFFIAYISYLLAMLMCSSTYAIYLPVFTGKYISILCMLLLMFGEMLCSKYNYKQIVILFFMLLVSVVNYVIVNDVTFVLTLVLIFCSHDISFRKISRYTVYVLIFMLIFVIASAKLGIIANFSSIDIFRERQYIGFTFPLIPATLFGNLVFLYAYYKESNVNWGSLLLFFIANSLIWYWTDSRLGTILTFAFLLFLVSKKLFGKYSLKNSFVKSILIFSYVISCFIGIYTAYNYNPSDINHLLANIILAGRLSLGYEALTTYPVTLLGMKLPLVGHGLDANGRHENGEYFWIDCLYIKLLLQYGAVVLVAYIMSFTQLLRKYSKRNNYTVMFILALLAVHGIIDDAIMYLMYNPFLLMIGTELISVKKDVGEY